MSSSAVRVEWPMVNSVIGRSGNYRVSTGGAKDDPAAGAGAGVAGPTRVVLGGIGPVVAPSFCESAVMWYVCRVMNTRPARTS